MTRDEIVKSLHERLDIHRRNVRNLLTERAMHGGSGEPPGIHNGLEYNRKAIAHIKRQLAKLSEHVENLPDDAQEEDLARAQPLDPTVARTKLEQRLLEIDFEQPFDIFQRIIKQCENKGGAVLVVLPNSSKMGGDLFSRRIQAELKRNTREGRFFLRHIGFTLKDSRSLNISAFLSRMFKSIIQEDLSETGIRDEYINEVIKSLCTGLRQNSSTLYIKLTINTSIEEETTFFSWFINHFWIPLAQELFQTVQKEQLVQVKLVTLLQFDQDIPENMQQLLEQTYMERMYLTKIVLEKWTERDIETWLGRYSDLVYPPEGLRGEGTISDVARSIFDDSREGEPNLVHLALLKQLMAQVQPLDSIEV